MGSFSCCKKMVRYLKIKFFGVSERKQNIGEDVDTGGFDY